MPDAFTALPQRSDSETRNSPYCFGVNTSGLIEAAIVGRPVHTMLVDRYRGTQVATRHFRYLLPKNGGMLRVARNFDEHVEELARSLVEDPEVSAAHNRPFVESFVRPHGIGRPATPILVDAIEALAAREPAGAIPDTVAAR